MFYLIGLGLCDEKDITVRGLEVCMCIGIYNSLTMKVIKRCERVYLEAYTSVLMIDKEKLVRERTHDTGSL
jgi:diphthine synthase